jgi:hypothetical protein
MEKVTNFSNRKFSQSIAINKILIWNIVLMARCGKRLNDNLFYDLIMIFVY